MSGRRNRQKGLTFERDVVNLLKPIFPKARRWLENHKDDAASGIDIYGTGCFKIQCKKLAKYAPITMLSQVKCDPGLGDIPVLVTAGNNLPAMAVLPLEDLIHIIKATGWFKS